MRDAIYGDPPETRVQSEELSERVTVSFRRKRRLRRSTVATGLVGCHFHRNHRYPPNKTARTVAVREGETINAPALKAMFKHIIANNRSERMRRLAGRRTRAAAI